MGILDVLSSALGEAMRQGAPAGQAGMPEPGSGQTAFPSSFSEILANTNFGDLAGLVQRLSAGGLQEQVASWLGAGANLPVTADQLRQALGNQ